MTQIDKSDLEAKLREIEGVVTEAEERTLSRAKWVAIGATALVVGVVALSIWRSRKSKIRVEVYKL
jgi:hypothetical protein